MPKQKKPTLTLVNGRDLTADQLVRTVEHLIGRKATDAEIKEVTDIVKS